MTFGAHVKEAAAKAGNLAAALGRIMPNVESARSSRRRLLAAVVQSKLLYWASVWAEALKYKRNTEVLVSAQRRALLKVCLLWRENSRKLLSDSTVVNVNSSVSRLPKICGSSRPTITLANLNVSNNGRANSHSTSN
jgi:hypothetical protein